MHIRSLILAAVAAMSLAGAAHALTLEQAMNEVGGMSCSGSTCTSSETIVTTESLPDVVTSSQELVSPATSSSPRDYSGLATWCPMIRTMNGGWTYPSNVNADCVAQELMPSSGGSPAVYRTVTTTTPGGTLEVVTCSTTSKEMTYNGPNTDRAGAWSVDTSSSSSSGSC